MEKFIHWPERRKNLNIKLPAPPMSALWVLDVANASHLTDEHWHWAILFNFLGEYALCTKSLVCCHKRQKGRPKRF